MPNMNFNPHLHNVLESYFRNKSIDEIKLHLRLINIILQSDIQPSINEDHSEKESYRDAIILGTMNNISSHHQEEILIEYLSLLSEHYDFVNKYKVE
jgi:hypothetical protein